MLGGSHANSVTLGVTRFHKRFSPLLPLFHGFFCNQDCLVARVLNHIVNEDGHALAQPHLKVLLMRHVTGLLAEMFHWQCFNHYWIREQKEGVAIPLNPYMVDAVMGEKKYEICTRGVASDCFSRNHLIW